MLTIRLQRHGKKGQPAYRLVVAPSRSKLIAPPTEDLGSYNPLTKAANFKADRVKHWIEVGAQPSLTVHNLLVKSGVVEAPKKRIPMAKPAPKAAPVEAIAVAEAAPAAEAEASETPAEPAV
jgi:small subunit ribosomal protein S16